MVLAQIVKVRVADFLNFEKSLSTGIPLKIVADPGPELLSPQAADTYNNNSLPYDPHAAPGAPSGAPNAKTSQELQETLRSLSDLYPRLEDIKTKYPALRNITFPKIINLPVPGNDFPIKDDPSVTPLPITASGCVHYLMDVLDRALAGADALLKRAFEKPVIGASVLGVRRAAETLNFYGLADYASDDEDGAAPATDAAVTPVPEPSPTEAAADADTAAGAPSAVSPTPLPSLPMLISALHLPTPMFPALALACIASPPPPHAAMVTARKPYSVAAANLLVFVMARSSLPAVVLFCAGERTWQRPGAHHQD